jgi:hypothetical protein
MGRSPIDEFLDTLSPKQAQKVAWVLNLVEELRTVPTQYFQKMINTADMWEARVRSGSNIFRFLAFFDGPKGLSWWSCLTRFKRRRRRHHGKP